MAQVTVCDVCGERMTEKDKAPFDFGDRTIRLGAQSKLKDNFIPMDLCRKCMLSIVSHGKQEAE